MNIQIRKLEKGDMRQVINLLKENLSPFEPKEQEYEDIWKNYKSQTNVFGMVAHIDEKIVGYGTVIVETKIRGGRMAHIESIVSSSSVRRKGIGSTILESLLSIAKQHNCYKAVLACQLHNVDFYIANGYGQDGVSMTRIIQKP